nr:YadA-like family protein [uncultured Leptotrichia sp.]
MKNTKKKKSKKKISKVVFNKVAKVASLATTVVVGEMVATKNAEANVTIGSTSGSTLKATGASLIGSGNIEGIAIGTSSKVNGAYGIALGKDSTSVQEGAIAIGKDSNALNKSAISLGYNSKASGGQSVAIGGNIQNDRGAQATGDQSISIGGDTVASGSSSIAIGGDDLDKANGTVGTLYRSLTGAPLVGTGTDRWIETKASGEASIAVGVQATSAGDLATAFGTKTKASGKFSTALGVGASSDGEGSIAIGGAASSVGAKSIAIGTKVTTIGESASAMGYGSQANNKGSIAIGLNSKSGTAGSTEENAIAMGTNSQSLTANSVAIGTGSIGGSTGIGSSAVAIGNGASAKGSDGIALGSGSNANNMQNIAIGYKTETGKTQVAGSSNNTDIRNVSIGSEAGKGMGGKDNLFLGTSSGQTSNGDYNVAFGSGSGKSVTGSYNTAMGANAGIGVKNNNNVSIGADSGQNTDGLGNTAIGWQSGQAVKGNQNISMGYQSAKGLKGSSNTVIGNQAGIGGVEGDNNIIVGTNATRLYTTGGSLKVQNVVSLGTNSKAYTDNSMSIGSYSEATGKAAIAIGQGSKASKDNSMAIGNGTLANTANGDVALGSGSATKAVTAVSNVTITPPSSKSITYGTFAGNNPQSAVSVGTAGNERQIQNVAAGRVTKDSTDAINGSQLFAVANELGKTWKGNAGKTGSGELVGTASSTQVMPGDEVQFIAGDNLSIKQETSTGTQKYTYSLKKDVDLGPNGSLKAGPVTINNNGINAGNKTITNVSPGVNPTDAANVSQVNAAKTEVKSTDNSVTVTSSTDPAKGNTIYDLSVDAANKNLSNITSAGKNVINNIAKNSVDVVAGTNIAGVTTSTSTNTDGTTKTTFTVNAKGANVVAGDGVTVTSAAGANNVTDYTVAVKDTTLTTNGTTVTAGNNNNFAKAGDVANAITNAANAAKTEVKSPDSSINVTADNTSPDGHTIYNITVDKTGKVAAGDTKLVTGDTVNTAINKAVSNPLTFAGDNAGGDVTRKLGEKLNIKGGATGATAANNIKVTADGTDTLNIELAKDLTGLDSIVTNGGNTTINNSGITTPAVTANKVTINNAPTAGTDATNKTYVDSTKTEVTSNDNSVVVSKSTNGNRDVYDLSVDITKLDAANKDLSNITNAGKGVINNIARNSVDVVAGTNIAGVTTSTSTNTDGTTKTTFTVDAKGASVVAGDGVTVTSAAGTNNVTDYTVAVKNTSLTTSGTAVSTTDPNSYVKAGDLATAITNVGKAAKTEVKSSDNSIGVTSSAGTDGNTIYDLKVDTSGTVTPGNNKLVTGDTVNTAINNAKTDLINNNPLTFAGDSGTDVTRKLGEKLNVKGGATGATTTGNIAVKADGTDTLNIELAKDLTGLDSITTNGGTKIDNNGITINNGAGNPVTLGPTGLNNGGNPITGVGAGTNKTDAVNVGQLDDKIANSKWQLTTSKSTGTVNGTTVEDINPNEVVTIDAGKNIGITQSGNKITIDTDFTSVANAIGGGTTVDPTTGAINTTGANIGGTGKTNVSDAVAAAKTTVTSKNGSVTVSPTTDADGHTNYDLKVDTSSIAAGTNLTYKANGTNDQTTTLANGLDFNNGKNTVASVDVNGKVVYDIKDDVDLGAAGSIKAGDTTLNNGGITINNGVAGSPVTLGPSGLNNGGNKITNVAPGVNNTDAANYGQVKAAKSEVIAGTNTNVHTTTGSDGQTIYKVNADKSEVATTGTGLTLTSSSTADSDGTKTTTYTLGLDTTTLTTGTNGSVTAPSTADAGKVVTAGDVANAINNSGFTLKSSANGGTLGSSTGDEVINPGDVIDMAAGKNLKVEQASNGKITYSLSDNVDLGATGSIKAGDTTLNNGGITINNGAGSPVTLGPTGLNNGGNPITGVGAGTNKTDAVNVGQLDDKIANSKWQLTTSKSTGTVSGTTVEDINPNEVVTIDAGKNIDITQSGNKITIDTDFTSVANAIGGGTTVDPTTGAINTTGANIGGTGKTNLSDAVAAAKTTVTSKNGSVTVSPTTDPDGHTNYDLKVDTNSIAAGTNLTYKANGTNDQTTTLANGLDFNNGKNTVASVDTNGKVVYDIKDNIDLGTAGSVTAGNTTINNGGVTTPTLTLTNSTPINSSTGGKATVPTGNGNQAVTAQTVADAINALGNNTINLKAADGTVTGKQNLNKDGGLEFEITGSNGISTTATGNKVDVTIAQSGLTTTTSPTGAAVVTPTTGGNTYATAGDVANAIQNAVNSSGWNVVADKTGTGTTSGTVANELIKPGDTVKLQAGNNLNVDQTGGTFTYSLKDDISLNSVTTGDTKISNGGVTITNPAGSNVTLGPTGLNNGGNTITNVAPGVNNNDAANYGQVKAAKTEVQAGKNVTVTSTTGANNQTIYTVNTDFTSVANAIGGGTTVDPTTGAINTTGANIGGTGKTNVSDAVAAAKTTVTSADKSVTVVETTGTDGHSNYDLKVDTTSIAKNTNLTYKANGANNQTTTLSDGLDFQNGKNTVASVDANGKVMYDIKDNIDLGTAGSVTAGNTTINNGGVTTPTLTLTNSTPINSSTGGKATVPTGNGNQAVTAQTVADAINALGNNTINLKAADGTVTGKQNLNKDGGLEFEITGSNGISTTATGNKVDVTIAQSGLTTTTSPTGAAVVTPTTGGNTYATAGDVANAIQNAVNSSGWNVVADKTGTGTTSGTVANELIKPGDTVKLQAGNNLNVDQTGGTFTYSLKDDISLNSVTTGDTKISNGGVTITNPAGSNVTLGPTGLNNGGNTITNVGAGKNGTDAVNLDQLTKATGASKTEVAGGTNTNVTSSTGTNGQTIYKVNADKSEVATTGTGLTLTPTITTDSDGTKTTTYTLGLDTTTLTTGANGSVTAPSTADAGKVVTAGSVADAINKSGFTLKSSANGGTLGSSTGDEVINPGDVIDMAAGKNLKVEQAANGKITYSLLDNVDLGTAGSIKAGDTTLNNGGITINNGAAGSPVTLGPTGLNNGGNTITNVGAGKNGTDAVNLDQLTKATGASKTEVAGGTNTNVTSSTGTNGQTIYKVNADKSEVATTGTGLTLTPTITTDSDGTKTTTYTLGLDTTTLTTGANGSVTAPSTADAGKVVTAGSVADAINKSGFTLKSSANGGTLGSSTGDEVINPGDVIDMAAGKNLKVEQAANGKITYSLLDDININSVTAGNNKFDKTGLTISDGAGNTTVTTPSGTTYTSASGDTTKVGPNGITINNGAAGNPVSLTKNGLDNGGNTITNVAPGVNGTDAVNVTQLKNTVNNAVNNGPVVYTNAAGDKVVKANDGNYYKASDVDANGNPLPGAVAVNPTDINHSLLNADGTTTNPSKLTNIADGLISPTSKDAINGSQLYKNATSVSNIIGGNSVVNPDGTLTTSNIGNTGKNTVHDAIGYLNQGFNVTTSASNGTVSGTTVEAVKAGETVTIDAGKNIAVTQNGKTISIATKDDLSVNSVTATDPAGNTTVLNPTGTTITDVAGNSNVSTATSNKLTDAAGNSNVATAAGNTYTSATGDITNVGSNGITITSGGTTVSLTNAGLNNGGNKITNVAAGVAPTDAVNVSQLDTAVNNLNTAIGAAKTEVVAGTNTTVTSTQGANKQTIYKIDADGTTVSGGSSFVSVTPGTKDANNITDYKVDLSQSTKDTLNSIGTGNIAAGDNNTVTGSTVHNYLQNNPLTYTDDNGTTLTRNLGQNLNVVGRATGPLTTGNIGVVASSTDTLEVKLAENVNLGPNGSVTMGNTVVNNDGVTINGGPSITSNGIDGGGKKLTNVAEGDITPTSRDVVTGGQVYNAVIAGGADKATKAELSGVNSNLTAGIAGVAAMANLPQINDAAANRFNVAVAGGAYKNGRAMALGFSGISDGGRFIYKASASLNNKNDVTVGLGMGYQFGKRDVEPNELDRLKSMVTLLEQQKDSYSRQLKKQLEEEASKNRENSELIKQLMQEVQELKNRR